MRSLFPGFYPRTDEEISKLWQDGMFVFDTNMLLNVYRYTEKTRERYFEILQRLKVQISFGYLIKLHMNTKIEG